MSIFILVFVSLLLNSFLTEDEGDIRIKHLEQHHDEQVKYGRMIELLEDIKTNTHNIVENPENSS